MPHQLQSTTLYDIIQIIDGDDLFEKCLVSDKHCAEFDENPCTLHIHYEEIRKELKKMFSEHTIENLAREFKNSGKKIDL
jgi:DNA-binding IscR family transcriptional regulator